MVYLRLKRQIIFHNWNVKQLIENISYLSELFDDDKQIQQFIDNPDYFPINVGKSNAENAAAYVSKALENRNNFPNKPRQNTKLRENMQTVIHYFIDKFDADALSTFFKVVYKHLIGKSINEVDDSIDDDHLRYVVQKMKETRHQELIKIKKFRLEKYFNQFKKAVTERKAQRIVHEKIIKFRLKKLKKFFNQYKKAVTERKAQRLIRENQDAERKKSEQKRNKRRRRKRNLRKVTPQRTSDSKRQLTPQRTSDPSPERK